VVPRYAIFLTAIETLFGIRSAHVDEKLDVVATFSVFGNFVKDVGGDRAAPRVVRRHEALSRSGIGDRPQEIT